MSKSLYTVFRVYCMYSACTSSVYRTYQNYVSCSGAGRSRRKSSASVLHVSANAAAHNVMMHFEMMQWCKLSSTIVVVHYRNVSSSASVCSKISKSVCCLMLVPMENCGICVLFLTSGQIEHHTPILVANIQNHHLLYHPETCASLVPAWLSPFFDYGPVAADHQHQPIPRMFANCLLCQVVQSRPNTPHTEICCQMLPTYGRKWSLYCGVDIF